MGVVSSHQVGVFVRPVNRVDGRVDANEVRGQDNVMGKYFNAHDADATIHVQSSALADRPAFGVVGRVWVTTDGTPTAWLDTGTAWVSLSGGGGGGITALTGDVTAAGSGSVVATLALTLDEIPIAVASVDFNQQQAVSFVVENRTSDPGSPVTGQLWLRTDL